MRTLLQHLLPHKLFSKIAQCCADCKVPWIKNYLINYFLARYNVNMSESIEENPLAFPSYNDFFTRRLKPELRPIAKDLNALVSPADGALAQFGHINNDKIIQAKGHTYSVFDLLAGDNTYKHFIDGDFATIYLAPKDYHRVHMPYSGKLLKMIYIPGCLFSVNTHAAENIPNVFARNERVACIFNTDIGPMAVVLVGAMIVGGMETVWAGSITPPHHKKIAVTDYSNENITLAKGEEMGLFKLGSTVIMLFGKNAIAWLNSLQLDMTVKYGQQIATSNLK